MKPERHPGLKRLCAWRALLLLPAAMAANVAADEGKPVAAPERAITYHRDVAPLILRHCAECHRPDEVAPFPLLTYNDVRKRARQIQAVTADRYMPPWKPVAGHGEFVGARQLTADELALIAQWVSGGAVEGDPADAPPAPEFPSGWRLGPPDLIVTMPEPYHVPAEGPDIYRNFVIPLKIPPGKYIKAAEYRPGNPRVVHHAGMSCDVTGIARKRDAEDPDPGFTRFSLPGMLLPGSLAGWTPGREPAPLPEGFSMPWPEGADLVLQVHLHPSGKPEVEQSTIGFYLTDEPPRRSMVDLLLVQTKIDIPPGERAYRTRDSFVLPVDMEAFGIFPHMHLLGREIHITAVLPDGRREPLLRIDDWDFKWQNHYQYREPLKLPKGTKLEMECVHDNSADNPANPSQPPKRVRWGEQTTDEMAAAVVQFVPAGEADLLVLGGTLRRRVVGGIAAGNLLPLNDPEIRKKIEALFDKSR